MTSGRLRQLVGAGLVDSFGLALGWTVFVLYALKAQGLGAAGVYSAAMLLGVGLSAPAAGSLAGRLDGKQLLQTTAVAEAGLRVGSFALLLVGAPMISVVAAVALTNAVAWTGYAGMRAEVAAADSRAHAMTMYMGCVAAVEAAGAAAAALLPAARGGLLAAVIAFSALSLIPTFLIARGSRVPRAQVIRGAVELRDAAAPLVGGFLVMAVAAGPTLFFVALTADLYGRAWVAAAAIAFMVGALVAPLGAAALDRADLSLAAVLPTLGVGIIGGWIAASWHPAGLLAAQLLSGIFLTTFEGTMDASVARGRTAWLGWTAASRALGGAAAVGVVPLAIGGMGLTTTSLDAAVLLACAALLGTMVVVGRQIRARLHSESSTLPSARLISSTRTSVESPSR